jgi:hypothetical protein
VTETFDCTEAPKELRYVLDNGNRWLTSMTSTLERLDQQCSSVTPAPEPGSDVSI